jgi:TolB-like protein/AraC-like DNA-binding protein/Tfp pilus assembly protein PilF
MQLTSKYSIAVLPFMNMSAEKENEYFSDGVTEEILNSLCEVEGLHVTARTSSFAFKNQNLDVREIGKQLNVAHILEGSIRKQGENVRITAQLVKASDGYHLWSSTWDKNLKNIFVVQDEIAGDIAKKVRSGIKVKAENGIKKLENAEAIDLFLKANYLLKSWNQDETYQAIDLFKRVLELAPEFARAYLGIADCYTLLGTIGLMDFGEASKNIGINIQKAFQLDPDISEIYTSFAKKSFWYEWDLHQTLESLNKALELKPSNAEALYFKGMVYATYGKFEEAIDYLFQCQRLNPLSEQINYFIGTVYAFMQEWDKAVDYYEKNIGINPRFHSQYRSRIYALCNCGRLDEAWDALQNFPEDVIPYRDYAVKAMSGYYYACRGETNKALKIAGELEKSIETQENNDTYGTLFLAYISLKTNRKDKALELLKQGISKRSMYFLFMLVDEPWLSVKDDPRYIEAAKHIKLPSEQIESRKKYKRSGLTSEHSRDIVKKLDKAIRNQKLFLNPQLTLSDLAEAIDESTNTVSQALNENLGKNYYEYINSFRLDNFIEMYKDPRYNQFTMLAVAYESGFNSKSTFNAYFKKSMGKSPREYFKSE